MIFRLAFVVLACLVHGNEGADDEEDALPSSDSGYPLHDAVQANDREGMELVLSQLTSMEEGMRLQALDELDGNQLTALQMAAYTGHAEAAEMLLAAGAPTETRVRWLANTNRDSVALCAGRCYDSRRTKANYL